MVRFITKNGKHIPIEEPPSNEKSVSPTANKNDKQREDELVDFADKMAE